MVCDQPPAAVALFQGHEVAAAHLYHAPAGLEVDLEVVGHDGGASRGEHQGERVALQPAQDFAGADEFGPARDA